MSWQEIVVIIVAVLLVLTAFGRPVVSRIRRKKGKSGGCGGACGSCGCGSCPYCGDKEHEDKTRSDNIIKSIP